MRFMLGAERYSVMPHTDANDSFNGKPQATGSLKSSDACGLPLNEQTSYQ